MKVICTQENLKAGLGVVGKIISTSSTLPVLSNVLIKAEGGLLKLSATNLEIAITTSVRCKVETEGSVTVFARMLGELVASLPNANVTLETDGQNLSIESERYHTSVKTLSAEEFPLIADIEAKQSITVPASVLKSAIDEVVFAASTNQTQPEISGIFLSVDGTTLKLAATDRYRLAEKTIKLKDSANSPVQVIMPQRTASEISRILGGSKGDVEVSFAETQIGFSVDQTKVVSRLVDGQYPPYQSIIPESFTSTVVIPRQQLLGALRAGSVFSQSNQSIQVSFDGGPQVLEVVSGNTDLGTSQVEIPVEVTGPAGKLTINHRYLQDCLQATDAEQVTLSVTGETTAATITPVGDETYLYLVMPIKT